MQSEIDNVNVCTDYFKFVDTSLVPSANLRRSFVLQPESAFKIISFLCVLIIIIDCPENILVLKKIRECQVFGPYTCNI